MIDFIFERGNQGQMASFFSCLFSTWFGRKIGRAKFRGLLYSTNMAACTMACFVWGITVAYALVCFFIPCTPV